MATIQVRNVPEKVHRIYKKRAAAAGKSLQEYVLEEMVWRAGHKTPAEVVAEVREKMRRDPEGWAEGSSADLIREDRESR